MKKACMRIVLFLLLLQLVWLPVQAAAVSVQPLGMIDSILPDELPGSSTAPRDGQESTQPGRAGQGSHAAEQGAPTPSGEGFSVGMAVLVVGLAVISLVVALLYVFRGQSRRRD